MFFQARSNLLALLISLSLSLAGGEAVARYFGAEPLQQPDVHSPRMDSSWGQRDDELGWLNRPGTHLSVEAGAAPMRFLDGGRRATRLEEKKDCPGGRVYLSGDSWTQGYGVRDEETFGWLLDAENPNLCFENLGNGGFGELQSLMLLERHLASSSTPPQAVILGFTSYMASRDTLSFSRLKSLRTMGHDVYFPPFATFEDGKPIRHAPYRSPAWPFEMRSSLVTLLHNGLHRAYVAAYDVGTDKDIVTISLIEEMAKRVHEAGAKFVVARLQKDSLTKERYAEELDKREIAFLECESPDGFIPALQVGGNGHPNGEYHRRFADCIQSWVDKTLTR